MANNEIACPSCSARNRVPVVASGRPRCGKCRAELPWLVDVSTGDFSAAVGQSKLPVLVDLWAPWCGPCLAVAPVLEQLAVERAGVLKIAKVNVDQEPSISAQLGVQGIPTMVLFAGGDEIARQVGALPAERIRDWIDGALANNV